MIKAKNRVPEIASESFESASSFVDQLMHDKTFRRKLRAAAKASAAASRRAQTRTQRHGITSLASDPVLKRHVLEALSDLRAARGAQKRSRHRARKLLGLLTGVGALAVAILKLRHALGEKPEAETDNP